MDEPKKRPLPERAADAIPEDRLHLHNAFNWFCWQFDDIPGADKFLEDIAGNAIIENTIGVMQAEEPEAYKTDGVLWRTNAAAHIILRDALSVRLRAYIWDPDFGQTLKLGYDGWYPEWWDHNVLGPYAPFMSPYVHPDDPQNPGPLTATLRGQRRPVFFKTEEFHAWARPIIESASAKAGQKLPGDLEVLARLREATVSAIKKIWGPSGPPKDLSAKARDDRINRRLKDDGYGTASPQTIRRALEIVRRGSS